MTFNVSPSMKRNLLLVVTGLVVAYVRTFLQYHQYSWSSGSEFLVSWFIHYVGVVILVTISYAIIKTHEERFLPTTDGSRQRLGMDEALVYIPLTLLVCAISIFLLAHWPDAGLLSE
jgi:hypothetical protein